MGMLVALALQSEVHTKTRATVAAASHGPPTLAGALDLQALVLFADKTA